MPGNSFGNLFRITTYGESHGPGIGVVIDGCPPGIAVTEEAINRALARRRPGQSALTTTRSEEDTVVIQSGILDGQTTGAPIALWIANSDVRPQDYSEIARAYRPSHADFTYETKYGVRHPSGGGRSSARETAARVAAGAVAQALLDQCQVRINAYVRQVGAIKLKQPWQDVDLDTVDNNAVRCPHPATADQMEAAILAAKDQGDTLGGIIECVVRDCPAGLGEPVFDKLHADLGKAVLSINACKGVEFGSGFASAGMKGSEHNDAFFTGDDGVVRTRTNHSGGIQGGISNGMPIMLRAAFKPVSTLKRPQETVDTEGKPVILEARGRHDPCVVPRAVPIVEAMVALVLADHVLRNRAMQGWR